MSKTDLMIGDQVQLILIKEDGKESFSETIYTVKKIGVPSAESQLIDKLSIKLEDNQGRTVNALKTRVRPVKPQSQEEEKKMEEATVATVEKKPVVAKKTTTAKKPEPFDIKQFQKDHNNGPLLSKECEFDHKEFKLAAYIVIDPKEQFYYYINIYKYPDGTVSRCGSGDSKYPLKGIKYATTVKNKQTKQSEKKHIKGKETVEEVVARFQKKGYQVVK